MKEKIERSRDAMLRALMFVSPCADLSEEINDIANSIADNYEEYMEIWCFLTDNFTK